MSIPTSELKAAIRKAMEKKYLSKEFQKQVNDRWNATVGTPTSEE